MLALLALPVLSSCALWRRTTDPLALAAFAADRDGPLTAGSASVRWTAAATGGAGGLRYEFRSRRGQVEIIEQEGPSATWDWIPHASGAFRMKVAITDSAGDRVDSGWSPAFVVVPAVSHGDLLAVLPVDNLTGTSAPLATVGEVLRARLEQRGFRIVDDQTLERVMKRYRVRDTGGLGSGVSRAVKEETGAAGVLLTSLEVLHREQFPRVSLLSRLVASGDRPEIIWMDGVGLAGDGHPGLLARGQIDKIDDLVDMAVRCLVDSLAAALVATPVPDLRGPLNTYQECDSRGDVVSLPAESQVAMKFRPRKFFRSPTVDALRRYSVAVIPFSNLSQRKNAGEILALHFVNRLFRSGSFAVVEPGLVREELLEHRVIMEAGPSLENAQALSSDESLGVDLVFSGTVFDYQDAVGVPKVDFSVKVIEKQSLKVVWSSRSGSTGEDGVVLFDLGSVHTAHQLASEMARGTSEALNR